MSRIILIHGPMAAGKSTLTELLNKRLKTYSYVDRAYIKKELQPAGKINARKISKKACLLLIKELMKKQKNLIVQEFCSMNLKKKLRYYLGRYNYEIRSFYVHCKTETAIKRDIKRSKKTRTNIVKLMHKRNAVKNYPSDMDVPVNTEKLSIKQSLELILTSLRKT